MCGEKLKFGTNVTKNPGSPPRVRGKVASEMILLALERITPAYAGKRHVCSAPYKGTGDHPRVCGEEAVAIIW